MAKKYKIKRHMSIGKGVYKASPHPLMIITSILVMGGLIFLGIIMYQPVYDFIMSIRSDEEPDISEVFDPPAEIEEESSSEPEITEPEPPEVAIEAVRSAYMPFSVASDINAAVSFLDNLGGDINSVMIDFKDNQGLLLYSSGDSRAVEWGAVAEKTIDISELVRVLNERSLSLIARIQTFSDPVAARGDRIRNAIKYQNSEMLWLDNFANAGGKPWTNPYVPEVRDYLVGIAKELSDSGAAMIVLDGMRFPDDMTGSAFYGTEYNGIPRGDALKALVSEMEEALSPSGTRVAVSIPSTGINHLSRNARYGGNPLDFAGECAVITILPEELESGYLAEGVFVTKPSVNAALMVKEVLDYARSEAGGKDIKLIPMLRGADFGSVPLTSEQLDAYIEAGIESGGGEYILYYNG